MAWYSGRLFVGDTLIARRREREALRALEMQDRMLGRENPLAPLPNYKYLRDPSDRAFDTVCDCEF